MVLQTLKETRVLPVFLRDLSQAEQAKVAEACKQANVVLDIDMSLGYPTISFLGIVDRVCKVTSFLICRLHALLLGLYMRLSCALRWTPIALLCILKSACLPVFHHCLMYCVQPPLCACVRACVRACAYPATDADNASIATPGHAKLSPHVLAHQRHQSWPCLCFPCCCCC